MARQDLAQADARSSLMALALITSLFFFWGMANALNDVLIPQFKKAFRLSDLESGFVQSAFYAGYFFFALPAAALMQRYGFKVTILVGLGLFALGAFAFYPAADLLKYAPFLAALFILASGLAFLETSANPLVTVLGDPKGAAFRLNLAQAFNPLGCLVGIWIGQRFILSGIELAQTRLAAQTPQVLHAFYAREIHAVQTPYLIIGAVVVILALLIFGCRFPAATRQDAATTELSFAKSVAALFSQRRFLFGVIAQFFYVGAQVGVWSYTIKYAQTETGQTDKAAVVFLIFNYIAFTIGRFGGATLMKVMPPIWIFTAFALFNIVLTTLAATLGGWIGLWCLVAVSLFMSVMYPTIFAVSLEGLGPLTKAASSLLVMSIIGGAVITPIMGSLSDQAHLIRTALYVPAGCFVVLAIFGITLGYLKSHRPSAGRVVDFATSIGA